MTKPMTQNTGNAFGNAFIVDMRTDFLKLPLPNAQNTLSDDLPRIIQVFNALDENAQIVDDALTEVETGLGTVNTKANTAQNTANMAQATANTASTKADTALAKTTPDATTTKKGKAAFATEAETLAGTVVNKIVTPKGFKHAVNSGFLAHNTDANAHGNLLSSINPIDLFRYGEIGHPRIGHTMNDAHYIPADGRFVDLANYPELLEKIQNNKIDHRTSYSSTYIGVWSLISGTSYRSPDMRGHFVRFSATNVGLKEDDAIRNITGETGNVWYSTSIGGNVSGAFRITATRSNIGTSGQLSGKTTNFDAARTVPTANENRPKNIYQYPVIYLGKLATEMSISSQESQVSEPISEVV